MNMKKDTDWDHRFIDLAYHISGWSTDPDTKVGCVIVGPDAEVRSVGYNRVPRGVKEGIKERQIKPTKYLWTEHAERNAIYTAARVGTALRGCRIYTTWFPCVDCARGIVEAGLIELIAYQPDLAHPEWGRSFVVALELLEEAGVVVRSHTGGTFLRLQPDP
jgi:dCMP deaminase